MMANWFVTGKLGGGKTLASVGKIRDYLRQGRIVATNLDLKLEHLLPSMWDQSKLEVYRVPDKPTAADLERLPSGNTSYDESKNGLLVLDECGTWFNSRTWNDKSRQEVIDWFLHARKKGWDCMFIVQDVSLVDKQAREALCEMTAFCRRLDRIRVPYVGAWVQALTGIRLTLPKVHTARVHYGYNELALKIDRWTYQGKDLYPAYDTKQVFVDRGDGVACLLSPWHLKGRYMAPRLTWTQQLVEGVNLALRVSVFIGVHAVAWTRGRSPRAQAQAWGVLRSDVDPRGCRLSRRAGVRSATAT
jgi:hypothetical protein